MSQWFSPAESHPAEISARIQALRFCYRRRAAFARLVQPAPPDDTRKFPTRYTVQRLRNNSINPAAKVVITTIQRLYSMLKGDVDFDKANEEGSAFDTTKPWKGWLKDHSLTYTESLSPPDIIATEIVDELETALQMFSKIAARLTKASDKQSQATE